METNICEERRLVLKALVEELRHGVQMGQQCDYYGLWMQIANPVIKATKIRPELLEAGCKGVSAREIFHLLTLAEAEIKRLQSAFNGAQWRRDNQDLITLPRSALDIIDGTPLYPPRPGVIPS